MENQTPKTKRTRRRKPATGFDALAEMEPKVETPIIEETAAPEIVVEEVVTSEPVVEEATFPDPAIEEKTVEEPRPSPTFVKTIRPLKPKKNNGPQRSIRKSWR